LRAKEKEIKEAAVSGVSDTSPIRKILEQKDKDLDAVRTELRSAKSELSAYMVKLEVKEREIEDTKSQMMRTAKGDNSEQAEEIARLQGLLLDLKTTRVDLLEKLDDAQHEVETLKNEIAQLRSA